MTPPAPQRAIDKFWSKFTSKESGRPITILPGNAPAKRAALRASLTAERPKNAIVSYEQAAKACIAAVENIVRDCRRLNQKFKDPDFDIEYDHMEKISWGRIPDTLVPLGKTGNDLEPKSVKRVEDIFDKPHFFVEGMTANDVRQGSNGDCWLMASVCTLSNSKDLLQKLCVARDEKVGVYGFVFHRDGEWIYEVIDDKLYLTQENFDDSGSQRLDWMSTKMENPDEQYRKVMQTGSNALYFASCKDQNATWLPLLEKAYAKAHGDYGAIEGGWCGEGLEDLTGGVTSELFTADILDKEQFWVDELMNVNKSFLFGLSQITGKYSERKGIVSQHAYSIMEVAELDGIRLCKIKNPWGEKGWEGPWGNGSKEWTPDRMVRLNHTFENDGSFWISYPDLLRHWQYIDRTRLFGSDWSITQHWTSAHVPWSVQYLDTFFRIKLEKASPVVIMLCQLDDRYFKGLDGQYGFELHFRLQTSGKKRYIAQSKPSYFQSRSATTELDLETGEYDVMVKIVATWYKTMPKPEKVMIENSERRPQKLLAVGRNYDIAHAKGGLQENETERREQIRTERREKRRADAKKTYNERRLAIKKAKLSRLRIEARQKSQKSQPPQADSQDKDPIAINITMGAKTLQPAERQGSGKAANGTKLFPYDANRRELKVTIETSEKAATGQGNDPASHKEQAADATKLTEKAPKCHLEGIRAGEQIDGKPNKLHDAGGELKGSEAEQPSTFSETDETAVERSSEIVSAAGIGADSGAARIEDPSLKVQKAVLSLEDISDDCLSWSSDIDAPPDSDSESEDSESDSDPEPLANKTAKPASTDDAKKTSSGEKEPDKWDAVCVFGLRVFAKGAQAEIDVRRGRKGKDVE